MKVLLIIVALTLGYIYLLTIIFEYCINKASSTLLTLAGMALILVLTAVYAALISKNIKHKPK
jgi:hypothetical protein